MNTKSNQIIKVNEVSTAKSSALSNYIDRTIETLKISMSSIEIPKEGVGALIATLFIVIVSLLLILGNLSNTLSQQTYQLQQFSENTELTADYHRYTILSDYMKTIANEIVTGHSQKTPEKSAMIRALTQATLQELDPGRKRYVVMFLHDANLLKTASKKQPSLLLGASLTGANLQGLNLKLANLQGANLTSADLRGTDLRGANLENAILAKSCYNTSTLFDKKFIPSAAGMRKVADSQACSVDVSR